MERKAEVIGLNSVLAAHFAPRALDELVVTRRDFPHWMRPDLQKALESLFSALPSSSHDWGYQQERACCFTGRRAPERRSSCAGLQARWKELLRRAAQALLERGGDEALEACDIDHALTDMLGASGPIGARMLGAEPAIGFANHD